MILRYIKKFKKKKKIQKMYNKGKRVGVYTW